MTNKYFVTWYTHISAKNAYEAALEAEKIQFKQRLSYNVTNLDTLEQDTIDLNKGVEQIND
jgi:hypothetical protein